MQTPATVNNVVYRLNMVLLLGCRCQLSIHDGKYI